MQGGCALSPVEGSAWSHPAKDTHPLDYRTFIETNARWLGGGFILTLAASFGQTFFISLFGGEIRAAFDLSHGGFGSVYTVATLASAGTLIWLGKFADEMRVVRLSALVIGGLAFACLGMSLAGHVILLGLSIYFLRLMGQGMLTHIAMTAMGRWFSGHRGRAVGVVSLGHSTGEAVLPFVTILLIGAIGWQQVWIGAALCLAFAALPAIWFLFQQSRTPSGEVRTPMARADNVLAPRDWTRAEVLRDPVFYGLMPGMLGPPFITTGIVFHQIQLMDEKAWNITTMPAVFPLFAASSVLSSLTSGWLIDRWNATFLLPFFLLPLGAAVFLMATVPSPVIAAVFMVLAGMTVGMMNTMSGALWPELYGVRHLGAIRALTVALMVFGTSLAPGFVGVLVDLGISISSQMIVMAAYTLVVSGFLWHVMRVIHGARTGTISGPTDQTGST